MEILELVRRGSMASKMSLWSETGNLWYKYVELTNVDLLPHPWGIITSISSPVQDFR